MVSVRPNTITQPISDQYVIVLYPLTERAMIKWYLADMRIHWVLHEIHFITTQIHPGFYIYTLERSFCLIVSIIINIRYSSHCIIGLGSHWVLHDIHVITTKIRPGFYIYTLERSFCLMINIMINIRYISRCVIQIFKSVRFILHALSLEYISSSVHVKNLPPIAPQEDAWARCRLSKDNTQITIFCNMFQIFVVYVNIRIDCLIETHDLWFIHINFQDLQ